jgi:hypothetical protein
VQNFILKLLNARLGLRAARSVSACSSMAKEKMIAA